MKPFLARLAWRPLVAAAAVAAVALLVVAPSGLGLSGGATKDSIQDPGFAQFGCTACHGQKNTFRPVDNAAITFRISDASGGFLNGPYAANAVYTISITLNESVAPAGGAVGNHAGFNLRASAGKLEGVAGQSQATSDGTQATHSSGGRTSWDVKWTAPAAGAVAFQLFVNDVDGSGANDEPDVVHEMFFGLTDKDGAILGAAAGEEHVEFGISLQQYWIGLIGLAGMVFIMVAGFVYLKFVNPHNTDQKDR